MKTIRLDILFVDRRGNEGVHLACFQVRASALKGSKRGLPRLRRAYSQLHGRGVGIAGDEVQSPIARLPRVLDDVELYVGVLLAQGLRMLFGYFGIAVHDRAAYLRDMRVA